MIKHVQGDIFKSGADVILHQVNCKGVMGTGVAKQVREKYPEVYKAYKDLCDQYHNGEELLGRWQAVCTDIHTEIVNIFGQHEFGYDGKCYTNYEKLKHALMQVKMNYQNKTIAIPYLMGCHRGGGDWKIVYEMIEEIFRDSNCDVLICEYNGD